jgi:hypothetical protein
MPEGRQVRQARCCELSISMEDQMSVTHTKTFAARAGLDAAVAGRLAGPGGCRNTGNAFRLAASIALPAIVLAAAGPTLMAMLVPVVLLVCFILWVRADQPLFAPTSHHPKETIR